MTTDLRTRLHDLLPEVPEVEPVTALEQRNRARHARRTQRASALGPIALVAVLIATLASGGVGGGWRPGGGSFTLPTAEIWGERPPGYDEPREQPGTLGGTAQVGSTPLSVPTPRPTLPATAAPRAATADGAGATAGVAGSLSVTSAPPGAHIGLPPSRPSQVYAEQVTAGGFVDPAEDPLSTFAVDVDTAAYALTRTWIEQGYDVNPDLVRVEEFVNAFDYGYPDPDDGDLGVTVVAAPSQFLPEEQTLVRVAVQTTREVGRRPDANLTLVVDVSGSMREGERLEVLKAGIRELIDALRESDRVAIIAYSDTAWVELQPTLVAERSAILDALERLHPWASTNAEDGLTLAYDIAEQWLDPERVNRVVLASDGVANVGTRSAGGILDRIQEQVDEGIDLITVGVGISNYNDELLEQLADRGNGFYSYVDDAAEAGRFFASDLVGALVTVARDAKLQVAFDPETVARYRLIGFENRGVADDDFRNDEVDAGEIGAGHTVTALYAVELTGAPGSVAEVTARWLDAGRAAHETSARLATRDVIEGRPDPAFRLAATIAAWAEYLRASPYATEDYEAILASARMLQLEYDHRADVSELASLIERAR